MKIVNIIGGLGNQMFEYAMYLALKDAHPEENIKVCTRSFRGYGLHNGLEIERIFRIKLIEASIWDLFRVAYIFLNYRMWQIMLHVMPKRRSMTSGTTQIPFSYNEVTRKDSVFYDGYWQNEGFFKPIRKKILETYSFPAFKDKRNENVAERLINNSSVSIHIRRGDYLNDPVWFVCTLEYYKRSLYYIFSKDKVDLICVFSDDIQWCKDNLKEIVGNIEIEYVDWNKGSNSFRDMQLMTYCKHNIIANSSFSWWGAWLGQRDGKIVVAPKGWVNKEIVNNPICENWVSL